MIALIDIAGPCEVGMGINPHHRHVAPVPCRQIGERYHADGTLPSQRNNPVGSRGPQHRQRRLRLAEDDIAVDNAVLYRAGCHGGIHRNGQRLPLGCRSEKIQQPGPQIVSPRSIGRVFHFRHQPDNIGSLPLRIDEPNGFHLFPHTFAPLLYDLPNRKSSVRHGPVFLSFPGNYRTHRA